MDRADLFRYLLRGDYVRLGTERFYVPQGEGYPIDQDRRTHSFDITAAPSKDGSTQIKTLMHGDKALCEALC